MNPWHTHLDLLKAQQNDINRRKIVTTPQKRRESAKALGRGGALLVSLFYALILVASALTTESGLLAVGAWVASALQVIFLLVWVATLGSKEE